MRKIEALIAAALTVAALWSVQAAAGNWFAFAGGPIERMQAEDLRLARAALQRALATGDEGEAFGWANSRTGAHGSVTVLAARLDPGGPCRRLAIAMAAQAVEERGVWTFCRVGGAWTLGPPDRPAAGDSLSPTPD